MKKYLFAIAGLCLTSCASTTRQPTTTSERDLLGLPAVTSAEAAKWVTYAPQPRYPLEARRQGWAGAGVYLLRIQISSGRVKSVSVVQSTGRTILDSAAMSAFKTWRFKPGVPAPIKILAPQRKDPFAAEDSLLKVKIRFAMRS